jgi:hypothetical protein
MTKTFVDFSNDIASEFLSTAVIIDDKVKPFSSDKMTIPSEIKSPPKGASIKKQSEKQENPYEFRNQFTLNSKNLVKSFSDKGLVCAVLSPDDNEIEEYIKKTINIAKKADIVIIDWELHDRSGENALKIIKGIIANDINRKRFINIYTGVSDIFDNIVKKLEIEVFNTVNSSFDKKTVCFTKDSLSLTILVKIHVPLPKQYEYLKVTVEELPDKIISQFSSSYLGIIPNATIKALSSIRNNTHKILNKFNYHLDAPYLSHRGFSDDPKETEKHIAPLIASELLCIFENNNVSDNLSIDIIKKWLDWNVNSGFPLHRNMKIRNIQEAKKTIINLLQKGIEDIKVDEKHVSWGKLITSLRSNKNKKELSEITRIINNTTSDSEFLDCLFAEIMSVKHSYDKPIPFLNFGTIIKESNGHYYLCIQQPCDCNHLKYQEIKFSFLPLIKVEDNSTEQFDIVINESHSFSKLKTVIKAKSLKKIPFKPLSNKDKIIKAKKDNDNLIFSNKGRKFYWICELRFPHIQRIANIFAHDVARVGLTESEWLRRCAK